MSKAQKFTINAKRFFGAEPGAVFIEIALFLPLFLAGIAFVIWLAVSLNARSTLTASLGNAVRLAATRGDADKAGKVLLSRVNAWAGPQGTGDPPYDLFVQGVPQSFFERYDQITSQVFGGETYDFKNLNTIFQYAIVYLNQAMKEGAGGAVRFPCNPCSGEANDPHYPQGVTECDSPNGGAGCLSCIFLNPEQPFSSPFALDDGEEANDSFLGLECKYQPDSLMLRPLLWLVNLLAGPNNQFKIIITRRKAFNYQRGSFD